MPTVPFPQTHDPLCKMSIDKKMLTCKGCGKQMEWNKIVRHIVRAKVGGVFCKKSYNDDEIEKIKNKNKVRSQVQHVKKQSVYNEANRDKINQKQRQRDSSNKETKNMKNHYSYQVIVHSPCHRLFQISIVPFKIVPHQLHSFDLNANLLSEVCQQGFSSNIVTNCVGSRLLDISI